MKKLATLMTGTIMAIGTVAACANTHTMPTPLKKMAPHVTKTSLHAKVLNINTASAKALESLKGVGSKKAAAIVAYRKQHGKFKDLQALTQVKGLGSKRLANIIKQNPGRLELE